MAWNQANKKYRRARSFGGFIIRAADTVEKVRSKLARTPGGGSYVNMRPARSRLTGRLGLISQVRNSRKLVCAYIAWTMNKIIKQITKQVIFQYAKQIVINISVLLSIN